MLLAPCFSVCASVSSLMKWKLGFSFGMQTKTCQANFKKALIVDALFPEAESVFNLLSSIKKFMAQTSKIKH